MRVLGINLDYVVPSTIAGFIFAYTLVTYDSGSRLRNTILVLIAWFIDWCPVLFGGMISKISLIGAFHGLLTFIAYIILAVWIFAYDKKLYEVFWWIWVVAYVLGYLA